MPVLLLPHALAQHRFYTELYSAVPTDSVALCRLLNLLDNKLADDQRDSCEHPLCESECFAVLKTMSNGLLGLMVFAKNFSLLSGTF